MTKRLLGGPVGAQLTRDDLAGHPELTELWLLQSALSGSIPRLRAFDEIVDVRAGGQLGLRASTGHCCACYGPAAARPNSSRNCWAS